MSIETILDQYPSTTMSARELTEILLIAKIEETRHIGEFVRRIGSGWMFEAADGLGHTTWDLERTLEEARPRNLTTEEIYGTSLKSDDLQIEYVRTDLDKPHQEASGVRITHLPTGETYAASGFGSRLKNTEVALRGLAEAVYNSLIT